jgi:hypothetical protein
MYQVEGMDAWQHHHGRYHLHDNRNTTTRLAPRSSSRWPCMSAAPLNPARRPQCEAAHPPTACRIVQYSCSPGPWENKGPNANTIHEAPSPIELPSTGCSPEYVQRILSASSGAPRRGVGGAWRMAVRPSFIPLPNPSLESGPNAKSQSQSSNGRSTVTRPGVPFSHVHHSHPGLHTALAGRP